MRRICIVNANDSILFRLFSQLLWSAVIIRCAALREFAEGALIVRGWLRLPYFRLWLVWIWLSCYATFLRLVCCSWFQSVQYRPLPCLTWSFYQQRVIQNNSFGPCLWPFNSILRAIRLLPRDTATGQWFLRLFFVLMLLSRQLI